MDNRRFDGLTRALAAAAATPTTRRGGLLAALAAVLLPGAGAAQEAAACLPDGTRCARRKKDRGQPCRRCCSGASARAGKRFRCAVANAPIATGEPCDAAAGDVCADAAIGASCQAYAELTGQLFERSGTYCLFASPGTCQAAASPTDPVCTGGFCADGQCGDIALVGACDANARSCTAGDLFFTPAPPPSAAFCLCVVDADGNDVAVNFVENPLVPSGCSANAECGVGQVCWIPPTDVACAAFFPAAGYCALPC